MSGFILSDRAEADLFGGVAEVSSYVATLEHGLASLRPRWATVEKFLHDDPVRTPTLRQAALARVQFETIHPFLDGNGRLGRILITFVLCREGVLPDKL